MIWNIEENVPDMTGKTVLITGCTSGVGYECASQLLQRNATIVMACRNASKMETTHATLLTKHSVPADRILQIKCDVSDLDSVRSVPDALQQAKVAALYAIVLNAGIAQEPCSSSAQGVELTFATNVLGHWLLAKLLLPFIRDVPSSRIVAVTSLSHFYSCDLDEAMIRCENDVIGKYRGRIMYAQTKAALHWFINGLNDYLETTHARTVAVTTHPGYAASEMTNPASAKNAYWTSECALHALGWPFQQSTEQGAWSLTHSASCESISRANSFGPGGFMGLWGAPVKDARKSKEAGNSEKQAQFWRLCEELSGESYDGS